MDSNGANNRRLADPIQAVEAMDIQENPIEIDNMSNNGDANMQTVIGPDSTTATVMDATTSDALLAEEEIRSEATFEYRVENFSKLKESLLSPPTYVRNLPWKIMVMPRTERGQPESKSLGFFLQCNAESESTSWTCNAVAELRLKSFKPGQEPFSQKIKHLFYNKENDWGFSHFLSYIKILDPEKGYVQNDTIVLEVHVVADAPHGVFWDSKKHTGYVGLKNQGATCYMNSLLQTLYFTNQLRKAVYKMPTEADDSSKSVALALQRVFHDLQFTDKPVGTKKLTKSFGWEALDSFMQHDVQEFLRVLLDKLESKMKGTCVEGTVPRLFEGKMSSYIKCKNIEYTSQRYETFYDIQLNIKGKKNIDESFKDYIEPETLEGDNKYDAAEHGFQEAEKGVIFTSFPPVLHLHLMRFQYDPVTDNSVKFNDRFEFHEEINLDQYLKKPEDTPAKYKLHAVLVHSGDNHGGHYVVYINPLGDGKWCKFDDDVVSPCSKKEAIEQNYGGTDDEMNLHVRHCSNAYMLVYIRESAMATVLEKIEERDIPKELIDRLAEEKRLEKARRNERTEAYVMVNVLLEEYFEAYQATDLFEQDRMHYRIFKLRKSTLLGDLVKTIVDAFHTEKKFIRIWPMIQTRGIHRPTYLNFVEEPNRQIGSIIELQNPWVVFVELRHEELKPFDRQLDIFLFFKFYDPIRKQLHYIGCDQYPIQKKVSEVVADINARLYLPLNTDLAVYEEINQNGIQKINVNDTLNRALKVQRDETHGSILIFERKHSLDIKLELPTCEDYFRDLLYRIEVIFIEKNNPNDSGFTLELSQRYTYEQMANAVGKKINADPDKIQFFKCQSYKDIPGASIKPSSEGALKEILLCNKQKCSKKLFYQRLSMKINELENKKQFKCLWVSTNLKEEKELVLYPNKNGTVKNLLEEAAKQIEFNEDSTCKLRIVEVYNHKLNTSPPEDTPLENLQSGIETTMSAQKTYRIEEVPRDELILSDNEFLIPVAHFSKDAYTSFGVPFFIKARMGEPYCSLKERIQKKLNVPEKEWEKYKFAILAGQRPEYITDDSAEVDINLFKSSSFQPGLYPPHFGLEHVNKSQKRSRYTHLEKAIKIYN